MKYLVFPLICGIFFALGQDKSNLEAEIEKIYAKIAQVMQKNMELEKKVVELEEKLSSKGRHQIAVVDFNKILAKYHKAIDFTNHSQDEVQEIHDEIRVLQKEIAKIQNKLENFSEESPYYLKQQKKIVNKQLEIQRHTSYIQHLKTKYQEQMTRIVYKEIYHGIIECSKGKNWSLVLKVCNLEEIFAIPQHGYFATVFYGQNVILWEGTVDISDEVIRYLNKEYKKE
jgi:Skp family chaperone for outer membrane proteins